MSSCLDGCSPTTYQAKNELVFDTEDCYSVPAETQAQSIEPRIQAMILAMAQQAIDRIRARIPGGTNPETQAAISQISSAMLAGSASAFNRLLNHLSQLDSCQNLPIDLLNSVWAGAGLDVCLSRVDNQIVMHSRTNPQRGIVFDTTNGSFHLARLRQEGERITLGARIGGEEEAQRTFSELAISNLRRLTGDRVTTQAESPEQDAFRVAAGSLGETVPRGHEWVGRWADALSADQPGDGFQQRQMLQQLLRKVQLNNVSLVDILRRLNEAGANLRIASTTPTADNPHSAVLIWRGTGGREVRVPIEQPIS